MTEDKRKEIEDKIANATGYPLFKFSGQLKKDIGSLDKSERSYFLKLCLKRVHGLWKERFGEWEKAIEIVDNMPEPIYFKSESLSNILGYPCQVYIGKRKLVMISNGETNSAYIRDFGESEISFSTAKKIFAS